MNAWNQHYIRTTLDTWFAHIDASRFREEITPEHVLNMLIWMGDGYLHQKRSLHEPIDLPAMIGEFEQWCDMMRNWAYKPEYL